MLGFTQPGSSTAFTAPSLDDLWNLPTTQPAGAANPFSIAWYNATQPAGANPAGGGITAWLQANSTAVVIVAGALFALALFGGKRR